MTFSRQFRALLRLAFLWAIPWAMTGAVLGILAWLRRGTPQPPIQPLPLSIYLSMYVPEITALGVMSGLSAGLVLSWTERGRDLSAVSASRAVAWGILGGMLPLIVLGAYGLGFSLPAANLQGILLTGVLTAVASGSIAGLTLSAAKRAKLDAPVAPRALPST